MSLHITTLPQLTLEVVGSPLLTQGVSALRPRLRSKPSLPSRIAVIGNYLPRQCGIATFTTDLGRRLASANAGSFGASATLAFEAFVAQPNCGNRQLSSAAMWHRDLHHRPRSSARLC